MQHTHPNPNPTRPCPTHFLPAPRGMDPGRIAGYAVAVTLNAGLLLALLVPMTTPPLQPADAPAHPIVWVQPKAPVVVPVRPPSTPDRPKPVATRPRAQPPARPAVPADIVDAGQLPSAEARVPIIEAPAPVAPASTTPAPAVGMRLEYLQAPPPAYPRAALRARSQGTVLLQVLVDVDGRPLQVVIQAGSGDRRLDAAAREQVLRHWRFRPAVRDGRPVQAIGLVPVAFNLRR